jgi:hypothetical protein
MNLTLASVGGFLPTIIKGFGYSNAQVRPLYIPKHPRGSQRVPEELPKLSKKIDKNHD